MDDVNANATAMALLGLLASGTETSGYELRQWAARSVGHWYATPAQSQVYRELANLQERGWVRSRDVPQTGKPDKTVHAITRTGLEALARWVEANPPKPAVLKHHPMLRLFLGGDADPDLIDDLLRAHRERILAALDDLETQAVALGHDPQSGYADVVAEWAAELHRGDLRGVELALKALAERRPGRS